MIDWDWECMNWKGTIEKQFILPSLQNVRVEIARFCPCGSNGLSSNQFRKGIELRAEQERSHGHSYPRSCDLEECPTSRERVNSCT